MFQQYSRRMVVISSQRSLVTIPKILLSTSNIRIRFAATPAERASLSTTSPRKGRQKSNQAGGIQWLPIEEKKRFDRLKAAGLPLIQINQYFAKRKQQKRDAANWNKEETKLALELKAEGMSDGRIHKLLRLQREDALDTQTLRKQPGESKAEVALAKWAEDKTLELEISEWSPMDLRRARHLKGTGLSPSEIGVCLLIIQY
jgi:DNA-binding transcriptional MerR regulator